MEVYIVCFEHSAGDSPNPISDNISRVFVSEHEAEKEALRLNDGRVPDFDQHDESGWIVVPRNLFHNAII